MLIKSLRGFVWKIIIKDKSKNEFTVSDNDNTIEVEYKDLDKNKTCNCFGKIFGLVQGVGYRIWLKDRRKLRPQWMG